jgi:uncharacterized protein YbjQ (UPF0145 family)
MPSMLITTTDTLEGREITEYLGICTGEAVCGANVFRDMFAGIRDIVGGRSGSYEKVLRGGKEQAIDDMCEQAREMGANAVIGVDLDYEVVGEKGSMLMVAVSGTAVKIA